MKNIMKKIALTLALFITTFSIPTFASTGGSVEKNKNLNKIIKAELDEFAKQNNIHIKIDDVNFKLKDINTKNIYNKIEKDIQTLKESLLMAKKMSINEPEIQPYLVNKGSYYIAKVWSGVPSGGHGYVQQDFTATISKGKITKINMMGNSYQTGVVYAKWNHNRSWSERSKNNTHAAIYMKGVLNYTLNIFEGGVSATFVEDIKVSNGKLVTCNTCY